MSVLDKLPSQSKSISSRLASNNTLTNVSHSLKYHVYMNTWSTISGRILRYN